MASREFLKILSSARLGDVFAQQKLASAYLNGSFKTPIQPGNALIWLEKCYFSLKNQSLEKKSSETIEISKLYEQITQIPLSDTVHSPSFGFAWDIFWELSQANSASAKWQLANLLMNPSNATLQEQV